MSVPIYSAMCIDYRFDALSTAFFQSAYPQGYYLATAAGGGLSLGYPKYCAKGCDCSRHPCDPDNRDMETLRKSIITNLNIALTLQPINTAFILNHQDCGAIRAFLSCSGYPPVGVLEPTKEICINARLLTYAEEYFHKKFKHTTIILGLIDANGTVATYNPETQTWTIVYGASNTPGGLWTGYTLGQQLTFSCDYGHCGSDSSSN